MNLLFIVVYFYFEIFANFQILPKCKTLIKSLSWTTGVTHHEWEKYSDPPLWCERVCQDHLSILQGYCLHPSEDREDWLPGKDQSWPHVLHYWPLLLDMLWLLHRVDPMLLLEIWVPSLLPKLWSFHWRESGYLRRTNCCEFHQWSIVSFFSNFGNKITIV